MRPGYRKSGNNVTCISNVHVPVTELHYQICISTSSWSYVKQVSISFLHFNIQQRLHNILISVSKFILILLLRALINIFQNYSFLTLRYDTPHHTN